PRVQTVRPLAQGREIYDSAQQRGRAGDRPVRVVAPANVTGCRIERIEPAVVGADEHPPPPDRRRGVDLATGRPGPAQLATPLAERGDLPVGRADVDGA